MIIKITPTDQGENGGYMFDIWLDEDSDTNEDDSDEGGMYEGPEIDALKFAYQCAKDYLRYHCMHNKQPRTDGLCDTCGQVQPKTV